MFVLLAVLLAQAGGVPRASGVERPVVPPNVRCVEDSFGNWSCTNEDRILKGRDGSVTVIPGRR
jgi:hypothetical protein